LAEEHSCCRKSLRSYRHKLQSERQNLRKVVYAVADRLEAANSEIEQLTQEKSDQLVLLSSSLLALQGSLMKERSRVVTLVAAKDALIDSQAKEIESLKQQLTELQLQTKPQRSSAHFPNQIKSPAHFPNQIKSPAHFSKALVTSRSVENLDTCTLAKPPVPSREAVNRKLMLNQPPPPPPPRVTSLKDRLVNSSHPPSSSSSCDTFKMADRVMTSRDVDDDGVEEKFDSGRESDETFDNESIKSESTDAGLSASPLSSTAKSPTTTTAAILNVSGALLGGDVILKSGAKSDVMSKEESVMMKIDNKTKVTYWTDTYL